eukprot:m.139791 g.139791  ORF g.139791 m.139791 type:complete len:101 (+) comp15957_c0_seq2:1350-1652(+)
MWFTKSMQTSFCWQQLFIVLCSQLIVAVCKEIGEFETSTTVGPPAIAGCLALYPGETIEVYDISKTLPERVATFSGETAMNAASTGNGFVGVHNSNLYYY